MSVTGCNYGVHNFVQKPLPVDVFAKEHLHVCTLCDASFLRACEACPYPAEGDAA